MKLETKLWEHQKDALRFSEGKDRVIFAHEMRTGKTLSAIAWAQSRNAKKILVVSPAKIVDVWEYQFKEHTTGVEIYALTKGSVARKSNIITTTLSPVSEKTAVVIINYEITYRDDMLFALYAWQPDVIIFDEAHRLKGHSTKTTRAMTKFVKENNTPVVLLTGTPMHNKPTDVFALARMCNPTLFHYTDTTGRTIRAGTAWTHFRQRYENLMAYPGQPGIYKTLGYINQDEMIEKLSTIMHVVKTKDVHDIPDYHIFTTPIRLKPSTMNTYREFAKEFAVQLDEGLIIADNVLVKTLRLREMSSGILPLQEQKLQKDYTKVQVLQEMVSDHPTGEPFVVFTWFKESINTIRDTLQSSGVTVGVVAGGSNDYKKFLDGEVECLIVQLASGSEGLELSRARYAYYYELPQSVGMWKQSLARLQGHKQQRVVHYNVLASVGTVEPVMFNSLLHDVDIVDKFMEHIRELK